MDSIIAALLRTTLRLAVKPVFAPDVPFAAQRRRLTVLSRLNRLPKGVHIEAAAPGGVPGE